MLPGAGLALLRASDAVDAEEAQAAEDEKTGLGILRRALEAPTRQIAENSTLDGRVVVDRMRFSKRQLRTGSLTEERERKPERVPAPEYSEP